MRTIGLCTAAAAVLACVLSTACGEGIRGATPPIPRWGGNDTTYQWNALVNMTDPADNPAYPTWTFDYYYDGLSNVSRYDHHQGQGDEVCKGMPGIPDAVPCTVVNSLDGSLYISFPTQDYCCRCGATFTIRSDWLLDGGTTYIGESTQFGKAAQGWLKYGNEANHYYTTPDGTQAPIGYREHKTSGLKQWDFLQWSAAPQEASLFAPPSPTCGDAHCGNHACTILEG